ncbi:exodeoxyribonuclease V subunit gamma [Burkholderia pseudomallei]|nr:exodeoxyribonuclease V subunit gamma [Burkholderia pseudomallei]VCK15857.1 exodeoxyribonuclease V subunit gamma [Burkholderia pseudomallei]VCK22150.1 exodeoxyribonuclease V subunit gamma [Burkholderia pseudomallei]
MFCSRLCIDTTSVRRGRDGGAAQGIGESAGAGGALAGEPFARRGGGGEGRLAIARQGMGKAVRVAHETGDMLPVPVTTSRVSGLRPRCRARARSSGLGARGSGLGVRSSEFGVRGSEFGARGSEFGARSSEFGVRSSEFGVRSSEFGVRGSEFGARSSEFGVRSSELGTRNSEPVRGARTRRIVGGVGWGGVGRGAARGRSAPRSAAVNGAMRRYLAVPGGIGWYSAMSAGRPGAPRRDAYSTPVRRAPARHSSISRTFTRLPLILPALSLRSASRAMPRSTAT